MQSMWVLRKDDWVFQDQIKDKVLLLLYIGLVMCVVFMASQSYIRRWSWSCVQIVMTIMCNGRIGVSNQLASQFSSHDKSPTENR